MIEVITNVLSYDENYLELSYATWMGYPNSIANCATLLLLCNIQTRI